MAVMSGCIESLETGGLPMADRIIRWFNSVASTNDLALAAAADPATPAGVLWLCDHQSQGRGRHTAQGRRLWLAPSGSGVLMSLLLRPKLSAAQAPTLTLAAAVGCAEAIGAQTGVEVSLKWPNDLLVGGRKLGGILTEARQDDGVLSVVIGVGINVNIDEADFDPLIAGMATSLSSATGGVHDRLGLATAMAAAIERRAAELESRGGKLGELAGLWEARAGLGESRVELLTPPAHAGKVGTPTGLADDGALRVAFDDGAVVEVRAGEVLWR